MSVLVRGCGRQESDTLSRRKLSKLMSSEELDKALLINARILIL